MKNLPKKIRSKKLSSRVDLTAMVSVSFLLIIFFMVVGELSKPKTLALSLPDRDRGCGEPTAGCYIGNRFYTVLLGENDKIITYTGILNYPIKKTNETNYSENGFRNELNIVNKKILEYSAAIGKPNQGAIVFIKPSNKSNYGNLVNILEEMRLANIESYAIVDEFTPEESKLLAFN
ncbi:biopolymer transporter ExbD [Flavobacterium endoglycinae]|uniref:Biopolymer transporter ExbD n=1 Tax=Flavobacterium endoglycinae TaxID=2816357 RepID=A0ABX7QEA3_9FLAO|nr:biopolymer transporter ExbD [Flavobacterium endoglycinae]QSW88978.1 biopolymer transporter ExbD [Flavobacterium endoglycinae]